MGFGLVYVDFVCFGGCLEVWVGVRRDFLEFGVYSAFFDWFSGVCGLAFGLGPGCLIVIADLFGRVCYLVV